MWPLPMTDWISPLATRSQHWWEIPITHDTLDHTVQEPPGPDSPINDIWRPILETCSNLFTSPPLLTEISWLEKHVRLASGWYASYWNAFLFNMQINTYQELCLLLKKEIILFIIHVNHRLREILMLMQTFCTTIRVFDTRHFWQTLAGSNKSCQIWQIKVSVEKSNIY